MAKLLFSAIIFLSLYVCSKQESWDDWKPEDIANLNMTCDETQCGPPCEGYAPPPYCPPTVTTCNTGCVCMLLCKEPRIVCFQAKDCMKKRWYLKRKNLKV
ncbi:unnamed protein product [Colias eurytheme]|nr:unnamed protein product [Colias eurytheme]